MIYAILGVGNVPAMATAIAQRYSTAHIQVAEGQWLVVDPGTTQEVATKLGVIEGDAATGFKGGPAGTALIVGVSGYSGLQASNLWEWMKAKLQVAPSG